jgi:N-acetylneuraminic acid mutarotase
MLWRGKDSHQRGPRRRRILALAVAGCFLAGCTPTPSASTDNGASSAVVSNQTKRAFLLRLIGFCAGVNNRLATEAKQTSRDQASPTQVADELERLIGQAFVAGAPPQDKQKFDAFIQALTELIKRERSLAEAQGAAVDKAEAKDAAAAEKVAYEAADKAGMAYGMPHLADCQKAIKGDASWREIGKTLIAVQQVGTALVNGRIWVLGGLMAAKGSAKVMFYDPVLNDWTYGTDLPIPLHHAMAVSYRNTLVVIGGFMPDASQASGSVTSNRVYRLSGNAWEPMPALNHARAAGAAAVVGNKIVVVGGRDSDGQLVHPSEVFDGSRWQDAAALPIPGDHLAGVSDGKYFYAIGGRKIDPGLTSAALQRFDPGTGHWTQLPKMPTPRGGLGAALVDGRIYAVGGEGANTVLNDVEAYDIRAGTWNAGYARLKTPRQPVVRHRRRGGTGSCQFRSDRRTARPGGWAAVPGHRGDTNPYDDPNPRSGHRPALPRARSSGLHRLPHLSASEQGRAHHRLHDQFHPIDRAGRGASPPALLHRQSDPERRGHPGSVDHAGGRRLEGGKLVQRLREPHAPDRCTDRARRKEAPTRGAPFLSAVRAGRHRDARPRHRPPRRDRHRQLRPDHPLTPPGRPRRPHPRVPASLSPSAPHA